VKRVTALWVLAALLVAAAAVVWLERFINWSDDHNDPSEVLP
jgi:hypothetical protein